MTLAAAVARHYLAALRDPKIDIATFVLGQDEHLLQVDVPAHRRRLRGRRSKVGTTTRIKRNGRVSSTKRRAKGSSKTSKVGAMTWTPAGQLQGFHPGADRVSPGAATIAQQFDPVDLSAAMVVVANERAAQRDRRLEQRLEARIRKLENPRPASGVSLASACEARAWKGFPIASAVVCEFWQGA